MIWGRNAYTPPPAVFPSTCASLLPPRPYTQSFLWPLANQIPLIRETIPTCQNKLELYLTLPLSYKRFLRLSVGGRCTLVWMSCRFSLTPWKVLNIKKQMQLFPQLWTVLSGWCMKCWCGRGGRYCQLNYRPAGWPWIFPSPFFRFFVCKKTKQNKTQTPR